MNITYKDCPCYQCLCVPRCRQKEMTPLFRECQPLSIFYYNEGKFFDTIEQFSVRYNCLMQTLKPQWQKQSLSHPGKEYHAKNRTTTTIWNK